MLCAYDFRRTSRGFGPLLELGDPAREEGLGCGVAGSRLVRENSGSGETASPGGDHLDAACPVSAQVVLDLAARSEQGNMRKALELACRSATRSGGVRPRPPNGEEHKRR